MLVSCSAKHPKPGWFSAGTASKQHHYCERQWGPLRGPAISEGPMVFDAGSRNETGICFQRSKETLENSDTMWFPCFEVVVQVCTIFRGFWSFGFVRVTKGITAMIERSAATPRSQLSKLILRVYLLLSRSSHHPFRTTVSIQNSIHLEDILFHSWQGHYREFFMSWIPNDSRQSQTSISFNHSTMFLDP